MSFNEKRRLDPSQVEDRRGRGRGTAVAVGGSGIGLVILVGALLLGVIDLDDLQRIAEQAPPASGQVGELEDLSEECQTGADANTRQDCRIVGYTNSLQAFWQEELSRQYQPATTVLFSGSTNAACGYASAAVGPFYCPRDQKVYLDLTFFEVMQTQLGAQGGNFAEAYVLAHEYGHHVQNLLGVLNQPGAQDTGPDGGAVLIELQADCLAGIWAHNATATGYLTRVTDEEIAQALDAAASVGDDRIQSETQGYVSPESWTHGSSEQRQAALKDGLESGELATCDTPGWN